SGSSTSAHDRIGLAPTARRSDSSSPCCASAPTPAATRPRSNDVARSTSGSRTTTRDDPTAPSATAPQPHDWNRPPEQRSWDLHLARAGEDERDGEHDHAPRERAERLFQGREQE